MAWGKKKKYGNTEEKMIPKEFPKIDDIKTLVAFFQREDLPQQIEIGQHYRINSTKLFSEATISAMRYAYQKKSLYIFYANYDQLLEAKKFIEDAEKPKEEAK